MLRFVDAQCTIGRRKEYREGSLKTTADILEMMDRCHIEKAIAVHSVALEDDVMQGNRMLVEETEGNSRFLRQWSVIPSTFGEFLEPEELLPEMKKNQISSVRLSPNIYHHSLRPYAIGKLMHALAECHVPVFMDAWQSDWDSIYQLCQDYPDNSIVITTSGYEYQRQIAPILETCPNFFVGMNRYVVHDGIRLFCKEYGAERLVFETAMPYYSAAAGVALVHYAEVSEEEKELIAFGNVMRLISEVNL